MQRKSIEVEVLLLNAVRPSYISCVGVASIPLSKIRGEINP